MSPASEDEPDPDAQNQLAVASGWDRGAVLCIAGRGSLDEAVAAMLAQLLSKVGIEVRVARSSAASTPNLSQLDTTGVRLVCLSYLEPGDFTNARYLVRRLRRKVPKARIVVGFWTLDAAEAISRETQRETTADEVVTSLRRAIETVSGLALETVPVTERFAAPADNPLNAEMEQQTMAGVSPAEI